MVTNAVVFIHPDRVLQNGNACIQYCISLGYNVVGLVRSWEEAIGINRADPETEEVSAEVVVVAEEADLPPDRSPRLEIVAYARPEIFFQAKAEHEALLNNGASPAPTSVRPSRRERTRVIRRIVAE